MLLLDTAALPPEHRVDAFRAAFGQASVPCRIEHLGPAGAVRTRMHLWHYGRANLFTTDSSGFRLLRTPRHVRMESPPVVALAVQSSGVGRFSQFGADRLVRPGELMVNDLAAPYAFAWSGSGGSRAFQVSHDQLGLPAGVVRGAAPRLAASPLHDLVRDHLLRMARDADRVAGDPGAAALGTATTELVRALLVSAGAPDRLVATVRAETLVTRVRAYVRAHLAEPALTPERVAAAHNVSVRQLYKALARAGVSLEQELIGQRLELARTELLSPVGRRRPIAATARACGFADPSHFTRRFRAAYGVTPREWQQQPGR
ncbi:helix-turn-helix domain-containing protein [Geodermatophilus sp. CPCC 205761]|uniref:helix-turn-helix domain-containing protein n=1 Tax=Geodermatophilus sp. CPCC 205761 TaxID=2936597 RepID=UPI003EEAF7CC